jgi:ADP-ribose pyrophosphatase YjhB (NUDIX family)
MGQPTEAQKLSQKLNIPIAREYGQQHLSEWPGDTPTEKDEIFVETRGHTEKCAASSTRVILIGHERSADGEERLGFVCAVDGRGKYQRALGGGKVYPDFDILLDQDAPKEETVRQSAIREIKEELDVILRPENLLLVAVRRITEQDTGAVKLVRGGLTQVDACYVALTTTPLGYFAGQRGETGERMVKTAKELLRNVSHEERHQGVLPMLPLPQSAALAVGILALEQLVGSEITEGPLRMLLDESIPWAEKRLTGSSISGTFLHVIQASPWVP